MYLNKISEIDSKWVSKAKNEEPGLYFETEGVATEGLSIEGLSTEETKNTKSHDEQSKDFFE